jgi:hypothetical protein
LRSAEQLAGVDGTNQWAAAMLVVGMFSKMLKPVEFWVSEPGRMFLEQFGCSGWQT